MKIAVYGATGMVGSEITAEAVRRGHDVTAISRTGKRFEGASATRAADFADIETFRNIAGEHDVIVISVPPDRTGKSHGSYLQTHRAIIASPVPARVFVVGGAGALEVDGTKLIDQPGFPEEYRAESSTVSIVLDDYRASSGLDWTMLAPAPIIAPGERTGTYRLGLDNPVGDGISSQDFAVTTLDELEEPKHRRVRFTAASDGLAQ